MRSQLLTLPVTLLMFGSIVSAQSGHETQTITIGEKTQIPESVLAPGEYTFSVEDRLQDRAIVRITSSDPSKHVLVLGVPAQDLKNEGANGGLIFFRSSDNHKQILRGWVCPGCSEPLEFVYPKAEAAKITDSSAQSVLAVDPTYDKLPKNLSPDDMRVVTLWLLSPNKITAKNHGEGVAAEKYAETQRASATQTAQEQPTGEPSQVEAPAVSRPVEMASAVTKPVLPDQRRSRLPKTASDNFSLLFGGLLLLTAAGGLRLSRRKSVR